MRLLFDQNISFRIVTRLHSFFEGSKQVTQVGLSNCTDIQIWKYAFDNEFVIVTFDADFYDISLLNGSPPKVIWLRTGNMPTNELANWLIQNKEVIDEFINSPVYERIACLELNK